MPNYQGHLAGGAFVYIVIINLIKNHMLTWDIIIPSLLFCLLGSLFPDVDIKSKGQKIFHTLLAVALVWFMFAKRYDICTGLALFGLLPLLVRHRGIFHNIFFLGICLLAPILLVALHTPLYVRILGYYALFFCAGAISHVFLDRVVSYIKRKM